ncbi:MAG: hypothetical protein HY921_00575 [Elusimicrobia bacterium]|nr:hypothetical protein [Elusimicrobiota bacterium]
MSQQHLIKLVQEKASAIADRARASQSRADDILFRSQQVANALKNGFPLRDRGFGDDLQVFRKILKTLAADVVEIPNFMARLERTARYEEDAIKAAQALFRDISVLQREIRGLQEKALMAHQNIRNSPFFTDSIYLMLEIEKMIEKTDLLPAYANKILIAISSPSS